MDRPRRYLDPDACAEAIVRLVGDQVVLGIPLGMGKPNHVVNALYRRACGDPSMTLAIYTALTLGHRRIGGELERRLVQAIDERLLGDYPDLDYAVPAARGELPDNISVHEFYLAPGQGLRCDATQQDHVSINYTHALDHARRVGVNVFAQLVSPGPDGFSLSCNADIGADLIPELRRRAEDGAAVAVVGQVNHALPYMYGAEFRGSAFDAILASPRCAFQLPRVPRYPIDIRDHWIGLHASALIRDGGTLEMGIGTLGDAITNALLMRQRDNERYRALLEASPARVAIEGIGGTGPFERGLYAATEMLTDGVLHLHDAGILARRVYQCAPLQRLLDQGAVSERVDRHMFEALCEAGVTDPELLWRLGVLRHRVTDLDQVSDDDLGDRLQGGVLAHAGFFLGSGYLYQALHELGPEARARFRMESIAFVNELYRDYELKCAQRRHARFINTGMIATALGAVASDGLEDGRVVSGVGGQYNFVAMAHALPEARSILLVRATRENNGEVTPNIRYNYGHVTIPRHLRDILVTEYGIADVRGLPDSQVAMRIIEIADSRFQKDLVDRAKRHGKLPESYQVPEYARHNLPERLADQLAPHRSEGRFPALPFGSEISDVEWDLMRALRCLEGKPMPHFTTIAKSVAPPDSARPYLERMELEHPEGLTERVLRSALLYGLSSAGII